MNQDVISRLNVRDKTSSNRRSIRVARRTLMAEGVRFQTFKKCTASKLTKEALARDGFFFVNYRHLLECSFCDLKIRYWSPNSDVAEVYDKHRKSIPQCPFVLGLPVGNIPLFSASDVPSTTNLEGAAGNPTKKDLQTSGM